jgi:hypothetical protein
VRVLILLQGGCQYLYSLVSEKRSSRKLDRLRYAASCMSIRSALQAEASPSAGGIDLASSNSKTTLRKGVGSLRYQPCSSNAPVFMQEDEFPPNDILGNSAE